MEQNNVKGEKRFFLSVLDGIAWDVGFPVPAGEGLGARGRLTIPFEFRPLTEQENIWGWACGDEFAYVGYLTGALQPYIATNSDFCLLMPIYGGMFLVKRKAHYKIFIPIYNRCDQLWRSRARYGGVFVSLTQGVIR